MPTTLTRRAQPLVEAIRAADDGTDSYKTELYVLVNYAAQVRAYQLPNLQDRDQWPGGAAAYQQTQTSWATMTGSLQAWSMATLNNVTELPKSLILDSAQIVEPTLNAALSYAAILVQDPNNTTARNALMLNLNILSTNFAQYSAMTTPLINSLESQAGVFDSDAQAMQTLAAAALQTAGNDGQLIINLNQQIDQLNSDIKAEALVAAGGSLISILGLVMGAIAILLAPETGGISLALLVPAGVILVGGAVIIGLASTKIVNDKAQITTAASLIGVASSDIALVNLMANTVSGFASQVDTLKSALSVVIAPWQAAETYFTDTIAMLSSIESPQTSDWSLVQSELSDISAAWTALMSTVQGLVMDTRVSPNAQLQIGMTSQDIQQAIDQAGTITLTQYIAGTSSP